MRGADEQPGSMFSDMSLEVRISVDHPAGRALELLSPCFGTP